MRLLDPPDGGRSRHAHGRRWGVMLRSRALTLLAAVALAAVTTTAASGFPTRAHPAHAAAARARLSGSESALLREMNHVRVAHGLGALRLDGRLERAARAHSGEMLRTNVFAHGDFAARMTRFRVRFSIAGENLAWGTGPLGSATQIVAAWLASPEHRANLLRPSFSRVGVATPVGAFLGNGDAAVVTADFAG